MTAIVTTSWDDGHILDLRIAELLDRYGLTGTFYIARDFLDERMNESQIRELAQRHEIGAHTLTHPVLTEVSLQQAELEIRGSKTWLEDVLGAPVTTFCYPKGANNPDLQRIVQEAGYTLARSVERFTIEAGKNPYAIPTTLNCYPYPLRPFAGMAWFRGWRGRLAPVRDALPAVRRFRLSPLALLSWQKLAEALLGAADQQDGIWHLWGHSWEIEQYGLWDALEQLLKAVRASDSIRPIPNSQIIS